MKILPAVIVAALLSSCGIRVTTDPPQVPEPKPQTYPKYFGTVKINDNPVAPSRDVHIVCLEGFEYYYMEFDGGLAPRYRPDTGQLLTSCTKP